METPRLKYHEYVARDDGVYMHVPEVGYGIGELQSYTDLARKLNKLTAELQHYKTCNLDDHEQCAKS